MKFIKGFTFGFMTPSGKFADKKAKDSLRTLVKETGCDTIIFTLAALQDTAQSEQIDYIGKHMPTDEELLEMINLAKTLELRIIIKPLVNCRNGVWRAHINFFDQDIICEPKWSKWFESYIDYQLHYAKIAEKVGAEMLIVGCEMVQSERRTDEWIKLIKEVKKIYSGLVSYNTDKYQEENVRFWDEVDVISSSGYYPIDDWDNQLDRIYKVVKQYDKPFFFAEAGCPSRSGSAKIPNNWEHEGTKNVEEQKEYYQIMFEKCSQEQWIQGYGLWDWSAELYSKDAGKDDDGYGVYGKPASDIIKNYYDSIK
ncbi:MAG: 1,4-beta-xylanase [Cellulosilyticaceae bacterium]